MKKKMLTRQHLETEEADYPYRAMLESMNEGALTLLPDGTIFYCNPCFAGMVQASSEKLIGAPFQNWIASDEQSALATILKAAKKTSARAEFHLQTNQATSVPVQLSFRSLETEMKGVSLVVTDLTGCKRAEDELIKEVEEFKNSKRQISEIEGKLNEAQAAAGIGSWDWDMETNQVWWSNETYRLFGVKPEEYTPGFKSNAQFIHSDDLELYRNSFAHSLESGEDLDFDLRIISGDGVTRYCKALGSCSFSKSGKPVRFIGTLIDISEQKQVQQELSEGEVRLRRFYESGLLGVIYWNMNGSILDANDKFLEMVGYSREDLAAGRIGWAKMTPPEYQYLDERSTSELKANGVNRVPFEKEYFRKDGTRVPILIASAMLDEARLNGVAYVLDITDRKGSEDALRESENRFRALIENNADAITLLDARGTAVYDSPAAPGMLGYGPQDWIGKDVFSLIHPDDLPGSRELFKNLAGTPGAHINSTFRLRHKSGTWLWVEMVATNLLTEPGVNAIVLNYRDITGRKQLEAAMYLMSDTQREITRQDNLLDIYQLVGKRIQELIGDGYVSITRLDEQKQAMNVVGLYGFEGLYEKLVQTFKVDPSTFVYSLKDMTVEELRTFRSGRLEKFEGGLYERLFRKVPRRICKAAEKQLGITSIFEMGLVWQDIHFGGLTIFAKQEISQFKDMIETIMNQATLAIKRISADETLAHERNLLRTLLDNLPDAIYIKDAESRFLLGNSGLARLIGIATPDELIGKTDRDFFPEELAAQYFTDEQEVLHSEKAVINREEPISYPDGSRGWGLTTKVPLHDQNGSVTGLVGIGRDITGRRQAEEAIKASETRYRRLFEAAKDGILILDAESGVITDVNPFLLELLGYSLGELVGKPLWEISDFKDTIANLTAFLELKEHKYIRYEDKPLQTRDGRHVNVEFVSNVYEAGGKTVIQCNVRDITERKRSQAALARQTDELKRLYRASESLILNVSLDIKSVAGAIVAAILKEFGQSNCSLFLLERGSNEIERVAVAGPYAEQVGSIILKLDGPGLLPKAIRSGLVINSADVQSDPAYLPNWETARSELTLPLKIGADVIGAIDIQSAQPGFFTADDERLMMIFAERAATALENARLYKAEHRRVRRLSGLQEISSRLATLHSQREVMQLVVDQARALADSPECTIMLVDNENKEAFMAASSGMPEATPGNLRVPLDLPILQSVVRTGEALLIRDIDQDAPGLRKLLVLPGVRAFFAYPMKLAGKLYGFITLSSLTARLPSKEEITTIQLLAERTCAALENARLFEDTQRSLQQLVSLHSIDIAISGSFNLELTLGILLEQVITQLGVHATDILIYSPGTQRLSFISGKGFRTSALQYTNLRMGEGYAGRAAKERRTILVSNLQEDMDGLSKSTEFAEEGFVSLICTPLIAKGQIRGVLEVFHRQSLELEPSRMDFLEMLAGQAAIAIDNVGLFEGLQRSNTELSMSYSETIEGWSRALDLRDKETEGHTQRVTEMTINLARMFGINENDIVNMQRGALLHDIGKMGIPDTILLKPGPLTDEEWGIMRTHPMIAYELLSPITHLRLALDIPYCHHEKWDGTGYPRGLKGEQIPLAARLFAIVDVWDALTSDRPYRKAWTVEKALKHIQSGAGTHFDPRVVEAFLKTKL